MQQQNLGAQIKLFFKGKTLLSTLIAINVIVWLFMLLFNVIEYLFVLQGGAASEEWYNWFALSSDPRNLLAHPWTPITYMFIHAGFWHLFFNMIMLYVGGLMCSRYLGSRRFGWTYFMSGLSGAALYLLCYQLFPVFQTHISQAVGASAAVLGTFVAVATYMPDQEVGLWPLPNRFHFQLKWLAIAFVVIDLISIPKGNAGGHIAHIGGMLYGFLSIWLPRQPFFQFKHAKQRRAARNQERKRRRQERQRKAHAKQAPRSQRPLSDEEYNRRRSQQQQRVDAILDKISRSGYDSLTKEEKEILFKQK